MNNDVKAATSVDATESPSQPTRKRRPRSAKAPTSENAKRSLNLRVDDEVYERLTVHAMKARTTISDLVSSLTRTYCRDYSIHRTGTRSDGSGED